MPRFSLDASVFIQAKNGPYGMDFCPSFWSWIDEQVTARVLCSSMMVHDELAEGNDDLAKWVKARKDSGLFIVPSPSMQAVVTDIANHVNGNFPSYHAEEFLDGADPWVIAHAKVDGLIVVTNEVAVAPNSSKVKIPNLCRNFGVGCRDIYKMLRELKPPFMAK